MGSMAAHGADLAAMERALRDRFTASALSRATAVGYLDVFRWFSEGFERREGRAPTIADVAVVSAEAGLASQMEAAARAGRPWSKATTLSYRRQLRAVGGHLRDLFDLPANPLAGLRCGPTTRYKAGKGADPIRADELTAVLDSLDANDPVERVTRAIILLGYEAGPRKSELAGMRIEDFQSVTANGMELGSVVTVTRPAKGGSARTLPLGVRAEEQLRAFIGDRRTGPLFPDRAGAPLSGEAIASRLTRAGAKVGVALGTHRLRRSASLAMQRYGATQATLDTVFGWEPSSRDVSSGSYLRPDVVGLIYLHQSRLSPLDRLELELGRPLA